jgi:hypothetical protein
VAILRLAIAVVALGGVKDRMTGVREEEGGEEGEEREERIVLCQTPILFVIFRLRQDGRQVRGGCYLGPASVGKDRG